MNSFDVMAVPLDGRNLIESSAGTGKTYAISSLYVRLLLEKLLPVKQILAVTFTEAATADLKRRIRDKITETLKALQGKSSSDLFASQFAARFQDNPQACEILSEALHSFDEAAIFTIHGFCQRVLQENAFESAALFETEFQTNQDALLQEVVDDFWRTRFYPRSAFFHCFLRKSKFTPQSLVESARSATLHPFLQVIPRLAPPDEGALESLEQSLQSAFAAAVQCWPSTRDEVEDFLLHHNGLNRNSYRLTSIPQWLRDMEKYFAMQNPFEVPGCFEKLRKNKLEEELQKKRKGGVLPSIAFFDVAERLGQALTSLVKAYENLWLHLQVELSVFVRLELKRRKRKQNIRSYDDLLLDLYEALQGAKGKTLARAVGGKFRAILIDEFQDTDPLQYAIFDSICSHAGSLLFLVGDPKQAIYSFRGADVFAYLRAASEVSGASTLDRNWRSSPNLIRAVSALFQRSVNPFILPEITLYEVQAGNEEAAKALLWEGEPDPAPLKLWLLKRQSADDSSISKGSAESRLTEAVASEIVRLLRASSEGKVVVEGVPLLPGHIAVLVRTNREARAIQESLQRRRVPSVLYSSASVFGSAEALELERLLAGIVEARNETKVKAALATTILGVNGNELARLGEDDRDWDEWLSTFAWYRELWIMEGFMTMASTLITRQSVRSRLLSLPNGERRLINLLQILELIHEAVLTDQLGLDGVLTWLSDHRQEDHLVPAQEHQLRLETDDSAIRVVTIHKSKGLEYPVVFCPFCWDSLSVPKKGFIFHDPLNRSTVIRDLGSPELDQNRPLAQREALAENARLLYVALTRAKYRVYLAWGPIKDSGTSALARLLHPREYETSLDEPADSSKTMTDDTIEADLRNLALQSGQCIEVMSIPPCSPDLHQSLQESVEDYVCREFTRNIPRLWGISSYTALVSGRRRDGESPDRDTQLEKESMRRRVDDIPHPSRLGSFGFPRGSRAGSLLHEILQHADFSMQDKSRFRQLVREKLRAYGFNLGWEETVYQMALNVLSTPLRDGPASWRLGDLGPTEKQHELEFTFPLDLLTSQKLSIICKTIRPQALPLEFPEVFEKLEFSPVQGWMKGFIDMVFCRQGRYYLADWKSNFLGDQAGDYHQRELRQVMEREHYVLQYHLYSVALCRFLAFRLRDFQYDDHFGGIYYFFLRGIDPARGPDYGIYYDRPGEGLVRRLSQVLSESPLDNRWAWSAN